MKVPKSVSMCGMYFEYYIQKDCYRTKFGDRWVEIGYKVLNGILVSDCPGQQIKTRVVGSDEGEWKSMNNVELVDRMERIRNVAKYFLKK